MEVVNAVRSIVPAKNVNRSLVDHSSVSVTGRRWWVVDWKDFSPLICLKVELEKVISPIGAVIATKNVEVVVQRHRGMQRPGTGWVVLIVLLVFDGVPAARLDQSPRFTSRRSKQV